MRVITETRLQAVDKRFGFLEKKGSVSEKGLIKVTIQIAGKVDFDEASETNTQIRLEIEHLEDFKTGLVFVPADVLVCLSLPLDFPVQEAANT